MIRLLIFDLDGTLLSTEAANLSAYTAAFADVGVTLDADAYRRAWGLRFGEMVRAVAPGLSASDAAVVRERKALHYRRCFGEVVPNEPLIGLLRAARGLQHTALATTASRHNAEPLLAHFGLDQAFDATVFGGDVTRAKPHPECYLTLLERFDLAPQAALVFEDSAHGLAAAEAAGIAALQIAIR